MTELFFKTVYLHHGWPKEVVSDRDTRLTASFWKDLQIFTGTKINMSTANHPQSDGQTERANRTIIEALRAYVSPFHTDWVNHLTAVEFAYNDSDHAGTGFSPFYLNNGYHPLTPSAIMAGTPSARPTNVPALIKHLNNDIGAAKQALEKAQEKAAKQANKDRRELTFTVGQHVWLSNEYIKVPQAVQAKRKLGPKYYGPYTVNKVISPVTYRIDLPPTLKMYPVFHVSKLKEYKGDFDNARILHPPPPDIIDGEEHFYVEAFVNARYSGAREQYLVHWTGYDDDQNSYEKVTNLRRDLDKTTFDRLEKDLKTRLNDALQAKRAQRSKTKAPAPDGASA